MGAGGLSVRKAISSDGHVLYHLLYGREPVLPVDVPTLLTESMKEESAEAWAAAAVRRGEYFKKKLMSAALENLHTAQLRDARRYR
ncbi:hypothetical protein CLOM_g428 [Closterium sp. NIES-68]|nr:hypothetical protein CLOM_g428 [Closterium sp. NIES-68]